MLLNGEDPIGSMGVDTAPAVLSQKPKSLYNYFKQCFAQVTNPAIDPSVVEEARLEYPEIEFRQRFLAEWAESEGKVFKNIDDCFDSKLQPWQKGKHYLMGLDVAKQHDYTVAYVIDIKDMSIVASDRFNGCLLYTSPSPRD